METKKDSGRLYNIKRKSFIISILAGLTIISVVGGAWALGLFRPARQVAGEGELRAALMAKGSAKLELNETIELLKPLLVVGDKELVGTGIITFAEDARAQAGLSAAVPAASADPEEATYAQAAEELNAIIVNGDGKLKLSGEVTVDGAGVGNGVLVSDGGSFSLEGDAAVTGGFYYNIASAGEVKLQGGKVAGAGSHNILQDAGGSLEIKKGMVEAAGHDGVFLQAGAKLVMSGGTITQSGRRGIYNAGEATVTAGNILSNRTNIYNTGNITLKKLTIDSAQMHNVINAPSAKMRLVNSEILNSGAAALINQVGAELEVETLLIRRTGSRGIENAGGNLQGKNITVYSCGAVPLENMPGKGNAGGNVTIDGLTTSGASGMNVVQGSTGTMTLTNSSIGLTAVTSVQVVTGHMVMDNVTIEGTISTGAGVWILGGELDITNSRIKDTRGRGIAIAGGEVRGSDLTFTNIANVGIDNMPHSDGISAGTATFTRLSFSGGLRDNVANTSGGEMTISDSTLGATAANNVRVTKGTLRLTNVNIQGTIPSDDGQSSYHGIYSRGGAVYVDSSRISNSVAGGIRNVGGDVTVNGLTITNTKGNAVSNGIHSEGTYGNISLTNVQISGAQLGNIMNECPGTFTGKNLVLKTTIGNSIHIKDGVMNLDNVEVQGVQVLQEGNAYHCVYAPGGKLTISNSLLKNPITAGIRNAGADIVAENVTISGSPVNNISASAGSTKLINCELELSTRTNVNITAADTTVILDGTKVLGAGDFSDRNNVNSVYIAPGARLEVTGDSLITGSENRAGVLNEGGTFYLYDGEITGNVQRGVNNANKTDDDGKTHVAVFVMRGGSIHHNGDATVSGGGVYNGGNFTMHGGSIYHNRAHTGGAINTAGGRTTTIKGGEIYDNYAEKNSKGAGNGGALSGTGGSILVISGGEIYANSADGVGSGINHNASGLVLGKDALISPDNDIYIAANRVVTLSGSSIKNPAGYPVPLTTQTAQYGTVLVRTDTPENALAAKHQFKVNDGALNLARYEKQLAIGDVDDGFRVVAKIGETPYVSLQAAFAAVSSGGTIKLTDDIEFTAPLDITGSGKNITLTDDGNGPYTLSRADSFTSGRMFILRSGNTLTLEGSGGNDAAPDLIIDGKNTATAANSQAIAVGASTTNWNATLNLKPGVELRNNRNGNGGTAMIVHGTLNMSGGTLAGGSTTDNGGAVFVHNTGAMTVTGGSIIGNSGNNGGAVYVNTTGKLTVSGGTIAENTATALGNDIHVAGALTLSGGPEVGEIYLPAGKTITLGGPVTSPDAIRLVRPDYMPGDVILTGSAANIAASHTSFLPANANFTVDSGGRLEGVVIYVARIGANRYTSLGAAFAAVPNGGAATIEVMDNIELAASIDINGSGQNITLTDDGNGPHTISRADSFVAGRTFILRSGNTLTLEGSGGNDAAPDLIIDGKNTATAANSQAIAVGASTSNWDATLNLKPGVEIRDHRNGNGGTAMIVHGTLNMSGGVLTGGFTTDNGGAVFLHNGGTMAVTGGSITGNSGNNGGAVYVNTTGLLTVSGGSITGNTAASFGNDIYVAGTFNLSAGPNIGEVYLPAGKTITLSGAITSPSTIRVVRPDYMPGDVILTGSAANIAASHTKFLPANANFTVDSSGRLEGMPTYVAKIGANRYTTLALAFAAVPNNGTATIEIMGDIELTAMIDIAGSGKNITLTDDGNGPHTISRAASFTNARMILVRVGNTLTLEGSGGNDAAPDIIIDGNNVAITSGTAQQAIAVGASTGNWNATMHLNPGVKLQNHNANTNDGAAIVVFGTLHMNGGTITESKGKNGGGVHIVSTGTMFMTGGTVTGNTAAGLGNDIYVAGTFNLSAGPNIGEVYLPAGKTIALSGAITSPNTIQVVRPSYMPGDVVLTGSAANIAASHTSFLPANANFTVDSSGRLEGMPTYVAKIGANRYTTLASAFAAVPNGGAATIEVMDDIELAASIDINGSGQNITLTDDGNGPHTISRADSFTSGRTFILRVGNTLTLEGSGGNDAAPDIIIDGRNVATANNSQAISVGTSTTNWDATLNLKPGVEIRDHRNGNGGTAMIVHGTLNMSGGVLTGGSTTDNGGAVFLHNGGTITVTGGSITGNSGNNGGAVYVNTTGILTVTGGAITGNTATGFGNDIYVVGTLTLSDEPEVGEIYLPAGKTIALGGAVTPADAIRVALPSYTPGAAVLTGDAGDITASLSSFTLANTGFELDEDGRVQPVAPSGFMLAPTRLENTDISPEKGGSPAEEAEAEGDGGNLEEETTLAPTDGLNPPLEEEDNPGEEAETEPDASQPEGDGNQPESGSNQSEGDGNQPESDGNQPEGEAEEAPPVDSALPPEEEETPPEDSGSDADSPEEGEDSSERADDQTP